MAKITRDDVLKLAQLSKLDLTDEQLKRFTYELDEIVNYVEQLQSVDVSGLEPTDQVTGLTNVMREDTTKDYQASPEDLLKNVPAVKEHQIKVKRVIN
jgi:aspartyl-tRNA(Asn)/glutamyl-tRNA(Gln) amidotransferase subunit C